MSIEHLALTAWFPASYKSRNSGDEPVALLLFHSPIRAIHTRVSLRENWALRLVHSSSKEEKAHRAFCLPCAFRPVIQKKSQYCSPAGACREPNLSALVAGKLLVASLFPCTKKGKMEKEAFLNSCLGSLTSLFGSTAQQQLFHAPPVCYLETFLELEWRQGGCGGPAHSWSHTLARQRAFLVANGNSLLLAAWLFLQDPPSSSCRHP